jgi:hypothetical protein
VQGAKKANRVARSILWARTSEWREKSCAASVRHLLTEWTTKISSTDFTVCMLLHHFQHHNIKYIYKHIYFLLLFFHYTEILLKFHKIIIVLLTIINYTNTLTGDLMYTFLDFLNSFVLIWSLMKYN